MHALNGVLCWPTSAVPWQLLVEVDRAARSEKDALAAIAKGHAGLFRRVRQGRDG